MLDSAKPAKAGQTPPHHRELQPHYVREAKDMAARLRDGLQDHDVVVTRTASLEMLSKIHGYRNWNTMRAYCEQVSSKKQKSDKILSDMLGLETGDTKQIKNRLTLLLSVYDGPVGTPSEMWAARVRLLSGVVVDLSSLICQISGHPLTPEHLREGVSLGTGESWEECARTGAPMYLSQLYCWYLNHLEEYGSDPRMCGHNTFFDTLPGFSEERLLAYEAQPEVTQDQVGYVTMQITRPLHALIEDFDLRALEASNTGEAVSMAARLAALPELEGRVSTPASLELLARLQSYKDWGLMKVCCDSMYPSYAEKEVTAIKALGLHRKDKETIENRLSMLALGDQKNLFEGDYWTETTQRYITLAVDLLLSVNSETDYPLTVENVLQAGVIGTGKNWDEQLQACATVDLMQLYGWDKMSFPLSSFDAFFEGIPFFSAEKAEREEKQDVKFINYFDSITSPVTRAVRKLVEAFEGA